MIWLAGFLAYIVLSIASWAWLAQMTDSRASGNDRIVTVLAACGGAVLWPLMIVAMLIVICLERPEPVYPKPPSQGPHR